MADVHLVCGMICAGKTTEARRLEAGLGLARFSPDEWLHALGGSDRSFADRWRDNVEALQWQEAVKWLRHGIGVVHENGFWTVADRSLWRDRAKAEGARVVLHYLEADTKTLHRRLADRNSQLPGATYRVSADELDRWLNVFEPPTEPEGKMYDEFYWIRQE